MDLAILEQKNLVNAWKQAQNRQSKNKKRSGSTGRKFEKEKKYFDLENFSKTITTSIAKTILIAACFYGVFMTYRFATNSPFFKINKVSWFGHQLLSTKELSSWVGPVIGKNIFQLDLNKVSQKLAEHPWIKTVSARRIFPQSLQIDFKERTPFARVKLDQIYVMDNYGILLGLEEGKFNKLPIITGFLKQDLKPGNNVANEKIIQGLKAMYHINLLPIFKKNPIYTIHINNNSRITVVTHNRNMKVYMQPGMEQKSLKNLMLVLGKMGENENSLSYIDLSFKNKIVVKHNKTADKSLVKTNQT